MANNKGTLVLFSGPSGVGKDTILDIILEKDTSLKKSISLTTRCKRDNECDGKDYHFISFSDFKRMIDNNELLEYAQYDDNLYGTPKAPIDKWLNDGKIVILKIEVQGASKVKELYPDSIGIFILPPSIEVLEERLRSRDTENDDDISRRLEIAKNEIERSVIYDYKVINDEIDNAANEVLSILHSL